MPTPNRGTLSLDHYPRLKNPTLRFRHAMKLAPYVESAVVSDCFEFARRARILDIRASPYDASQYMGLGDDLDLSPIAVEHTAGRQQYQMEQSGRRFGPEKSGRRRKESCAVPADPGTELPIRYSGRRLRFAGKANSVPFENCVVERRSFLSFETVMEVFDP